MGFLPGRMKVARTPFLSLVTTIAAAASCDSTVGPTLQLPDGGGAATLDDAGEEPEPEVSVDAGPDAPLCDDDDGRTASCDEFLPDAGKCSAATCERALVQLKARVARREIQCMKDQVKLGTSCDGCRELALNGACDDPTADEPCEYVAKICTEKMPAYARPDCRKVASGMTFGARQKFTVCATAENGCAKDIRGCSRPD